MAIKQVIISDLGGAELDDLTHARIIVNDHPQLRGTPVQLDVSTDESGKLVTGGIALVSMQIFEPDKPPRRVVMDAATFAKTFKGIDMDSVIANATTVEEERPEAPQRRRGRPKGATAKPKAEKGEKRDYTSPEWQGVLHRGKVTDEEALLVRNDLEQANKNREREGQPLIDPYDAKEKARYGFDL